MNELQILNKLRSYCEREDYAGWDPYDGLNSKVFKSVPLVGRSAVARLVWIQLFKRNPLNLRRLLLVPKQRNAKGVGLFLRGYCSLYKAVDRNPSLESSLGSREDMLARIRELAGWLCDNTSKGFSGAAWGYNFPWQCRREFLFPAGEPTVVATYFCASALMDAFDVAGERRWLDTALSAAEFVKRDLRRTPFGGGVILSYSRMPGNDTIYNASLLGSALLARCHSYQPDSEALDLARQSVEACVAAQCADGSWTYGVKPVTGWIDSFHTGYNLVGISEYMRYSGDTAWRGAVERGYEYYLNNFFLPDGSPKYYHNRQYPIDIHCVGQLFVTARVLGKEKEPAAAALIGKVFDWSVANMWDERGYFYYQLKPGISSRISYMRWSNAFMFASLATLLTD